VLIDAVPAQRQGISAGMLAAAGGLGSAGLSQSGPGGPPQSGGPARAVQLTTSLTCICGVIEV
jgi:hypothetical protein